MPHYTIRFEITGQPMLALPLALSFSTIAEAKEAIIQLAPQLSLANYSWAGVYLDGVFIEEVGFIPVIQFK